MVIRFLCPNGHKIHCPDDRAGKAARCPKCGVKFQIPEISDLEMSGTGDSVADSGAFPIMSNSGAFPVVTSAERPERVEEQIEFLCPNGHRLHGPASLQGRPGQCPECGSRFRIPSYEDASDQEQGVPQEQIHLAATEGGEDSGPTPAAVESQSLDQARCEERASAAVLGEASGVDGWLAAAHPLAALFSRLWAEKSPGAAIELHLSNGETITPDHFAGKLSRGSVGVFGVTESDGTQTLTAVAWDSISRVLVRGLQRFPEEMHDQ